MSKTSAEHAEHVVDQVRKQLARANTSDLRDHKQRIEQIVKDQSLVFGSQSVEEMAQHAQQQILGVGALQKHLEDPKVTDILINDYNEGWLDRGNGLEPIETGLADSRDLRNLAVRLAAACGTRLDDSSPSIDGRLPDGTRLHAILHPLCESSAMISLRSLGSRALGTAQLINSGTIHPHMLAVLEHIVNKKKNFLVSGATGTGKTTLLSALLSLVERNERILIIEESREIRPNHPHVISLETKKENVEGKGRIDQSELLRNALRMRPDRIVVGECRGAEVMDMLSALNTGHRGGCGTIHANSAHDVVTRLHALGSLAGQSRDTVNQQAASAFDYVIHLERQPDPRFGSSRYIEEISEISLLGGQLVVRSVMRWTGRQRLENQQRNQEQHKHVQAAQPSLQSGTPMSTRMVGQ